MLSSCSDFYLYKQLNLKNKPLCRFILKHDIDFQKSLKRNINTPKYIRDGNLKDVLTVFLNSLSHSD